MTTSTIVLYVTLLLLGGVFSTVSGGGLGMMTIVLGSFFLDIRTNIAFTALLMTGIQLAKIAHFHSDIRWNAVKWYVLGGIPMSFAGGVLLFIVPPRIPEILLAASCVIFVILRFWSVAPKLSTNPGSLFVVGAANGFIGGITGNAAMMRGSALLAMGLSKEAFIGTSTMISFLMNLGKLAAYVPNLMWDRTTFILLGISIPGLMISVRIGKKILTYVSVSLFEDLQLIVILAGAIKLLFS